jgi:hypothetical protein
MQRRLRITLAVTAAAGIAVVGAGTAQAEGVFKSDKDCSYSVDKDKAEKEFDFPNDNYSGNANATRKDLRDSHGDLYYTHAQYCDPGRPWRGSDWDDDSYDHFLNKLEPGSRSPSSDVHKNAYASREGYNKSFQKNPHKGLEPDHIGAPRHPKYATE